jgi:protein-tyrosine-phosphatase
MHRDMTPLFVCHANCCRSVLAQYLYTDLCDAPATSAGLGAGDRINDRAQAMLGCWNIDASAHRPTQLTRPLCERADAIFVMGPPYLHRLVHDYGEDLADKAYLFADPFTLPTSFADNQYKVIDPSFDSRAAPALAAEYSWMRPQVVRIQQALCGAGEPLVPLRQYLDLCKTVDKDSH